MPSKIRTQLDILYRVWAHTLYKLNTIGLANITPDELQKMKKAQQQYFKLLKQKTDVSIRQSTNQVASN